MSFVEKLTELKKNVKKSSLDTYLRNIRRLRKVFHKLPVPMDAKWVTEKRMFTWYTSQPLSVRRHMSTAATIFLQVVKKPNEEWTKLQRASMKEFDDNRRQRNLSDKQKKQIPKHGFDSLKRVIKTMKKELNHVLSKDVNNWSMTDLIRVQDLLILSLYNNHPLRLDFATLELKKTDGNCIYKNLKKPRGWHVQLKEYKTSRTMGLRTFKLNISNQRLLNKFIPATRLLTKHGFLLTNQSGNKMTKQVLSKRLGKITKARIGKDFSVQLIRILFAMKHRDILESAKAVSEKLMHSTEQSLQYAKKSKQ